jgi:hypothetical protein
MSLHPLPGHVFEFCVTLSLLLNKLLLLLLLLPLFGALATHSEKEMRNEKSYGPLKAASPPCTSNQRVIAKC